MKSVVIAMGCGMARGLLTAATMTNDQIAELENRTMANLHGTMALAGERVLQDSRTPAVAPRRMNPAWLVLGGVVVLAVVAWLVTHSVLITALAGLASLVGLGKLLLGPGGPPMGSRSWEAKLKFELLMRMMVDRHKAIAQMPDSPERARLQREIDWFARQAEAQHVLAIANDRRPGTGVIGVEPYPGP